MSRLLPLLSALLEAIGAFLTGRAVQAYKGTVKALQDENERLKAVIKADAVSRSMSDDAKLRDLRKRGLL